MKELTWGWRGCTGLTAFMFCWACSCQTATPVDADAVADADADADSDADSDSDHTSTDGDADGDNPCLPDPDADADSDSDADNDADADGDADGDGDGDGDTDADSDVDTDGDTDVDADDDDDWDWDMDADLEPCPDDMIAAGRVCVDIWEASRGDATAESQGIETGWAYSRPGVIPWYVNPMSVEVLAEFEAACAAAGKRLCSAGEWEHTCSGPAETTYVFGNLFDRETCNCVDTFCDDHCLDSGIPEDECIMTDNCGYTYSCYHVVPTGELGGCTNELGTFDINGNVWEIVLSTTDGRGYEVRGGAFNCASAPSRLQCVFNAAWDALYAGFRCCKDR